MILICVFVFINNSNSCDCKYSKYGYWDTYMVKVKSNQSKLNSYLSSIKVNEIRPYHLSYENHVVLTIYTMKFIYKNDRIELKVCSEDDGMLNCLKINNKQFSDTEYDKKITIKLQRLIYKRYIEYFTIEK